MATASTVPKLMRPLPPRDMAFGRPAFAPAPELDAFVRATFLNRLSPLFIQEHEILESARIGYVWAAPEARDRGRMILGTAQLITPPQPKWSLLRPRAQLEEWFGEMPDFLITLSAPACLEDLSDAEFLALLDHELSHCGQQHRMGSPVFGRDGLPVWAIRGHDVEQFVGVVARWGAAAAGVDEMVKAAQKPPRFGAVAVDRLLGGCGTCRKAA